MSFQVVQMVLPLPTARGLKINRPGRKSHVGINVPLETLFPICTDLNIINNFFFQFFLSSFTGDISKGVVNL